MSSFFGFRHSRTSSKTADGLAMVNKVALALMSPGASTVDSHPGSPQLSSTDSFNRSVEDVEPSLQISKQAEVAKKANTPVMPTLPSPPDSRGSSPEGSNCEKSLVRKPDLLSSPRHLSNVGAAMSLGAQALIPLASFLAELAPVPYIGALTGVLKLLVDVVEKTTVNREQWSLLKTRCIMVVRIAGQQVVNSGEERNNGTALAADNLTRTINNIIGHAQDCAKMNKLWELAQGKAISDEIEGHFKSLDHCLNLFGYAANVAQEQWMNDFKLIQQKELSELADVKKSLAEMNFNLDSIAQNHEEHKRMAIEGHEMLRRLLNEKSEILQKKDTTMNAYVDAEKIVSTILKITGLELPSEILSGRQCLVDNHIPIRSGVTCDVYPAHFLGGEKVAKKVFRIGTSEKGNVDVYAKRIVRDAKLWKTFKSEYTLQCYGVGMETSDDAHFQLYIVSPLMRNFDAVTYLQKYRGQPAGMNEDIMRIIRDAARGLQYLHHKKPPVVHSGLRGSNVLITESGGAVLGGFGLTKALQDGNGNIPPSVMTGKTDSQRWMAPELLRDDNPVLQVHSDVWSWAMTALELLSGCEPYHKHKQPHTVMIALHNGKKPERADYPDFDQYTLQPEVMWKLLEKCWATEPKDRPTIDLVIGELDVILPNV